MEDSKKVKLYFAFYIPQEKVIKENGEMYDFGDKLIDFFENYQSSVTSPAIQFNDVRKRDFGYGSDLEVVTAVIEFVYDHAFDIIMLPSTLTGIVYSAKKWKELISFFSDKLQLIRRFFDKKEVKKSMSHDRDFIEYYPLNYVIAYAIGSFSAYLSDEKQIELKGAYQVDRFVKHDFYRKEDSQSSSHKEYPEKSFYSIAFAVDNLRIFQLWDSHLIKISEIILTDDPKSNRYNFTGIDSRAFDSIKYLLRK